MMIRGFLKTAAAVAAITALPAGAIAATPAASLSVAESVRAGAEMDEASDQFENYTQYAIPVVIVLVIGFALYFALEDDSASA